MSRRPYDALTSWVRPRQARMRCARGPSSTLAAAPWHGATSPTPSAKRSNSLLGPGDPNASMLYVLSLPMQTRPAWLSSRGAVTLSLQSADPTGRPLLPSEAVAPAGVRASPGAASAPTSSSAPPAAPDTKEPELAPAAYLIRRGLALGPPAHLDDTILLVAELLYIAGASSILAGG